MSGWSPLFGLVLDVALPALFAVGLALALGARGLLKRAAGLASAGGACALALASAGAGSGASMLAAVVAFAAPALALALAVRIREAYGSADLAAADAADDADDRGERKR